jgi:hypothetical protein
LCATPCRNQSDRNLKSKVAKPIVAKAHKRKKFSVAPRLDAGNSDKENVANAGEISDAKKMWVMI